MAGNAEEFGALVVFRSEAGEPVGTTAQNGRRNRYQFDIVDGRRAAIQTDIGRKWRLQTRLALLALERFEQRGFLAADISAGTMVE